MNKTTLVLIVFLLSHTLAWAGANENLFSATQSGSLEEMERAIWNGASLNVTNEEGFTP